MQFQRKYDLPNTILYHITKGKYIRDILTFGLKINTGKLGITIGYAHIYRVKQEINIQPIWLITNPMVVTDHMCSTKYCENNDCIALHINIKGIEDNLLITGDFDNNEIICKCNILPERITGWESYSTNNKYLRGVGLNGKPVDLYNFNCQQRNLSYPAKLQ